LPKKSILAHPIPWQINVAKTRGNYFVKPNQVAHRYLFEPVAILSRRLNAMRLTTLAFFLSTALVPHALLAAGSSDPTPPKPSETTQQCAEGLVFDLATQSCMTPVDSTNDDQALINDVRELAYDGRFADALSMLDTMQNQNNDMVATYCGFTTRKSGDVQAGLAFYKTALAVNPDNLLARSYMGQAMVEEGAMDVALAQLTEIHMRGGRGT
jgi:tetratricopeptide (TPR) repeat protein